MPSRLEANQSIASRHGFSVVVEKTGWFQRPPAQLFTRMWFATNPFLNDAPQSK